MKDLTTKVILYYRVSSLYAKLKSEESLAIPIEKLQPIQEYKENLFNEIVFEDNITISELTNIDKYRKVEKTKEQEEYIDNVLNFLLDPIIRDMNDCKCDCHNKIKHPK